jgi:DNA-directed RNA polymerase subunit RPC12/RpoP
MKDVRGGTIPADSFVRKTGQLWKLVLAGLVLPFPTALFGWWSIRQIRPDQPASEALAHIGILVVAAAVIVALLMSVRCPRCQVRLVAKVLRAQEGVDAITLFLKVAACPECGHKPSGSS